MPLAIQCKSVERLSGASANRQVTLPAKLRLVLATLLGGIDPQAVTSVFLITVSVAIFGCTLALTLSIWGSKPYEVLIATYAFFAIWLLAVPVVELLGWL